MELLQALEASGFSMWVKESSTAYVAVLAFHTVGLAFLVGISGAIALRILGGARSMPLEPMEDFLPLMYAGLCINAVTGLVLICLYPTNYFTEPTIYIKLAAVVVAMVLMQKVRGIAFGADASIGTPDGLKRARTLSIVMLIAWLIATVAGRVTAYTMPTKLQTAGAVIVFLVLALLVGYGLGKSLGWFESESKT
ncbi:MAG: hypothetical protein QF515_01925 [Pseudomonadales bacterium]|nr:hypothetical protein [Pseudomonadales bacterium]MDP6825868.1 hypothetical protein [Pseudomonadales bacterium]